MHFTRSRRRALFLAIIALIGAVLIATLGPDTSRPRRARGLLSVPTNQLSGLSPDVSNSTGITAATGAVRDTGVTNTTRSSAGGSWQLPTASSCTLSSSDPLTATQSPLDGNGLCSPRGGSSITTYQVPVTGGTNITFKFYMRSESEPRGQATVVASAYNASGVAINSWNCVVVSGTTVCNNQFWSDNAVNSRAGAWEETPEYIPIPSGYGITYVTFQIVRFLPNSTPVSKVWIDDLYVGSGFVHEEETAAKAPFDGTRVKIDANGAFQRKTSAGTFTDFFPMCMATAGLRGNNWSIYANNGWNCAWAVPTDSLQNTYWNGSGYSTTNWSTGADTIPAIAKRAVNSEFTPDGMLINVDVQSAVRGNLTWSSGEVTKLSSAIDNLYANGYGSQIFGFMRDAEWNQSLYQRMQAVWSVIDARDKANNGGVRANPIITNVGLPGNARAFTAADGTGALRTDYVGAYSGNLGPHKQLTEMPGNTAPGGYCQLQSGLGWSFRAIVYRCLGEGGHMISFWSDNGQAGTAYSLPSNPSPYGSYPLDATNAGSPYEPWFYSGDSVFIAREINTLLPLLKTPVPTDWAVTSSNANVSVWPRTAADGTPHFFVANNTTIPQTATFTVYGLSAISAIKNGITGATVTPTSSTSSTITMTIPGLAAASSAGNGGGTMVLKLQGTTVSGATTTTAAATTTTAAPSTTTTTTPPTSSSSHIDDTSFTCSPIASGASDESSGWKQYGPGFGAVFDPADYASSNRVTRLAGATCTVSFTGTAATLYGATGPSDGRFTVTLDGTSAGTTGCASAAGGKCETYAATSTRHVPVWSASGLTVGTHTIAVTVDGTTYAPSTSAYVVMDELEVSSAADHLYAATLPTPPSIDSGAAAVAANRINVNCNGTLTGVWWWRAATDTGTITVALWNTSGTLLASGSGDPAAGPGWRYLPFTTAADVVPGTTVIAGVLHPTGAYSYAYNGFTGRSVTSPTGCLTSPASTGGALNGTYAYSSTLTFPTSSYLDSEYFISPSFTPSIPTGPVIFRDDFTTLDPSKNTVDGFGVRNYVRTWRQNDYWQNAEKGYVDFTGNHGIWNANKWETLNVAGGGTTTLNPFSVSGGVLSITNAALPSNLQADVVAKANAQGQSPAVAPARYGGFLVTDRDWINPTTGLANTFKGGYYELRARFPDANGTNGKGLFPAWWLFASDESTNSENKGAAEIDIFEMFGFPAHSPITRTLHFGNNAPGSVTYSPHELGTSTLDMSQWHTYALNWLLASDAGGPRLDFYVDDVLVNTVSGTEAAWFTTPMSMRINFAADADFIIGAGRGTDGTTASTARFDVDYVEVRAPLGATSPTTTTTSPSTTTTTSAGTTTTTSTSTTTTTTTTPPTTTTLAPQPCIVGGAYNATASTSSSPATAYALTDQTSAGWTAASTTNQTITLDLGSDQTIGSIAFGWRARRAASSWVVDVRTSRSSRWTRVSTASGYRTNGRAQCVLLPLSARGRYVRVTTIGTEANLPVRLSELAVYP